MSKTVWIINQYASTPETGMGGRHFYLAKELAKKGYQVFLIAESSHHLLRQPRTLDTPFELESIDGFTFVWVKMPRYKDAHSKQRVANWFIFSWKIRKLLDVIQRKPDAILYSSPSPIAFLGAQRLARRCRSKLLFEVRDIWPLTLTEIGGYSRSHPLIRLMQWVEDKAYRDSDYVISNLENAVEHVISRGGDPKKFVWIPNGFSLDEVENRQPLSNPEISSISKSKFVVGYTGTIGKANAMEYFVEAAFLLKDYPDIAFVVVGDGREKIKLQEKARGYNLNNIYWFDSLPKVQVPSVLDCFDVCFIGWLDESLYRFGIAANKLQEYMYSGKPIIHSYSGGCDPVEKFEAGVKVPAQDAHALAGVIVDIYGAPEVSRKNMGARGRQAALEYYEYETLGGRLSSLLSG